MFARCSFALLALLLSCDALSRKKFDQDLNYDNPYNWFPAALPDENTRLVYPLSTQYAHLLLPLNVAKFRELALPIDGHIELADGVFQPSVCAEGAKCAALKEIHFKSVDVLSWMDAYSWVDMDYSQGTNTSAKPDYDRVPCVYDTVYFSPGENYALEMPDEDQFVKSIEYEGKTLDQEEWTQLTMDFPDVFQNWIDEPSHVTIVHDEPDCDPLEDVCFCHRDEMPTELCQNENCPTPKCRDPIQPIYFCCSMCVGVIITKLSDVPDTRAYRRRIEALIEESDVNRIDWYIGGVVHETVHYLQVVIVDRGEYDAGASRVAEYVHKHLDNKRDHLFVAGVPWDGSSGTSGWTIFIMLCLVAIVLAALVVYYHPPAFLRLSNPFSRYDFARFDNRSREGSLVLSSSHLALNKAFDNPMYDQKRKDSGEADKTKETDLRDPETEEEDQESLSEKTY